MNHLPVTLAVLLLCTSRVFPATPSLLDSLGIEVRNGSRAFAFTNKQTAFYYGETGTDHRESWQGFNVFGHEFLDDYLLVVNGRELPRSEAVKTVVYPDHLVREYPGGIVEQLRPLDSLAAVGVIVTAPAAVTLSFVPLFTDGRSGEDFVLEDEGGTGWIARSSHTARTTEGNYPVWLALSGRSFHAEREETRSGSRFSPMRLTSTGRSKTHVLAFAVGDSRMEAAAMARAFCTDPARQFRLRRERMERLLRDVRVQTENPRFDKAMAWAMLSLDALIMNQVTRGIFAGLPWFNNYWGRDTFISLPGACLVTGRFSEARAILRSFAAFQQTDSLSTDYGRIPNLVTTTDTSYNTADGTPRFVAVALEYIERSGDSAFAAEIYPVVRRSITGTTRYHTDSLGFLTHGDAETWMDAVGPDGPWSPRGNRANDIQALWIGQLRAGAAIAEMQGDRSTAERWRERSNLVAARFRTCFLGDSAMADHLRADGSADYALRPNQIFAAPLLDEATRVVVTGRVAGTLTYPYGVASLWQGDENFHPYHQYDPYYPKDAAYHNGTVWTWLQGALISEMCRLGGQETAFAVTENSVHQILDRGAVGTQSELLDALPRPGETEPRLSGTVSQAWNLAEFVRNFYDDYLGVRLTRLNHKLVVRPRLPRALGKVRAIINLDGRGVPVEVVPGMETGSVTIDGRALKAGGTGEVYFQLGSGSTLQTEITIQPGKMLRLELKDGNVTLLVNGVKQSSFIQRKGMISSPVLRGIDLATPSLRPGLRSLRGPDFPLLQSSLIKRAGALAALIASAQDEENDDTVTYKYPLNPNFVPGCLDITRFDLRADDSLAYFKLTFRALADPGWHPEYGFQLTYVALAIDQDGLPGSGQRHVPHNSGFILPESRAYERLIAVGGGVQIEDQSGKVLAGYIPAMTDVEHPLGNVRDGTIEFALPLAYLGTPRKEWRYTILVGAQDDHGGAGLGEFRTVNALQGEWNGGGRRGDSTSNVYDILFSPP
jgi:hypothetical protein